VSVEIIEGVSDTGTVVGAGKWVDGLMVGAMVSVDVGTEDVSVLVAGVVPQDEITKHIKTIKNIALFIG